MTPPTIAATAAIPDKAITEAPVLARVRCDVPEITVTFDTVPTFNTSDTQFRTIWAQLKGKPMCDSYRAWGDESLLPLWMSLASQAIYRGDELPDQTLRCLEIMELEDLVFSGPVTLSEDFELYPQPIAVLS